MTKRNTLRIPMELNETTDKMAPTVNTEQTSLASKSVVIPTEVLGHGTIQPLKNGRIEFRETTHPSNSIVCSFKSEAALEKHLHNHHTIDIWHLTDSRTGKERYRYFAWGDVNYYDSLEDLLPEIDSGSTAGVFAIEDSAASSEKSMTYFTKKSDWFNPGYRTLSFVEAQRRIIDKETAKEKNNQYTALGFLALSLTPYAIALGNLFSGSAIKSQPAFPNHSDEYWDFTDYVPTFDSTFSADYVSSWALDSVLPATVVSSVALTYGLQQRTKFNIQGNGYVPTVTAAAALQLVSLLPSAKAIPTAFFKTLGGTNEDRGYSVMATADGGSLVTGYTDSYGAGGFDIFLSRWASNGTLSWAKTLGGTIKDRGYSVTTTADDGVLVTGDTDSFRAGFPDIFLSRWTLNGALLWAKTLGGTGLDYGYSVINTVDGEVLVTGVTSSFGAGSYDMLLSRWTSNGTLSWARTLGGTGYDGGEESMTTTPDGGILVTGWTDSFGAGSLDIFLSHWTSNGTLSWAKILGGTSGDVGYSVTTTADGGIFVTGDTYSFGAGLSDIFLSRWTSNGTLSWAKTLGGTSDDKGKSVTTTIEGGILVTGWTDSFGAGGRDVLLAQLDSEGNIPGCTALQDITDSVTVTTITSSVTITDIPSSAVQTINPTVQTWAVSEVSQFPSSGTECEYTLPPTPTTTTLASTTISSPSSPSSTSSSTLNPMNNLTSPPFPSASNTPTTLQPSLALNPTTTSNESTPPPSSPSEETSASTNTLPIILGLTFTFCYLFVLSFLTYRRHQHRNAVTQAEQPTLPSQDSKPADDSNALTDKPITTPVTASNLIQKKVTPSKTLAYGSFAAHVANENAQDDDSKHDRLISQEYAPLELKPKEASHLSPGYENAPAKRHRKKTKSMEFTNKESIRTTDYMKPPPPHSYDSEGDNSQGIYLRPQPPSSDGSRGDASPVSLPNTSPRGKHNQRKNSQRNLAAHQTDRSTSRQSSQHAVRRSRTTTKNPSARGSQNFNLSQTSGRQDRALGPFDSLNPATPLERDPIYRGISFFTPKSHSNTKHEQNSKRSERHDEKQYNSTHSPLTDGGNTL